MEENRCGCSCLRPKLVTRVGEGYAQSKKCDYYYGVSERVEFGKDLYSAIVLYNPKKSRKNLFLNKLSCANYSSTAISVEVYVMAKVEGDLEKSHNIALGNTGCCKCNKNKGKILYGNDIKLTEGVKVYSRSIKPFATSDGFPNGSIILAPGTCRLYLLKTICHAESAISDISFAWWEESVHCCPRKDD
ncbi:DUF6143 family protein [Clostridiaceae bacterium M8S5]|nr:DUF6143 family protein [Clostridiaceae bacterium M8S5]